MFWLFYCEITIPGGGCVTQPCLDRREVHPSSEVVLLVCATQELSLLVVKDLQGIVVPLKLVAQARDLTRQLLVVQLALLSLAHSLPQLACVL